MSNPKTKWALIHGPTRRFSGSDGKVSWTYDRSEVETWAEGLGDGWKIVDAEAFARNPESFMTDFSERYSRH